MTNLLRSIGAALTGGAALDYEPCTIRQTCHFSWCAVYTGACPSTVASIYDQCDVQTGEYCSGPYYSCCP